MLVFLLLAVPGVRLLGHAVQFASGVSLVEVYVTVTDQRGEPVTDLTAGNFSVTEDGRPQAVHTFAAGDFPLSLAVAIDRSFSMGARQLDGTVRGVQAMLGEFRSDDRVTILAIGSEVETIAPLSNDHRAAYFAVQGLQPWGTTPLFDAAMSAIDAIRGASGRRALVLITDGTDRYSTLTSDAVIDGARRKDVLVYPVVLGRRPSPVFGDMARVTGGRSQTVSSLDALPAALSSIARELRHQYLLGYAPDAEAAVAGWRSIGVTVSRPTLRVRARDGYYADR
jgi:Ca-activated chloride channel family protein